MQISREMSILSMVFAPMMLFGQASPTPSSPTAPAQSAAAQPAPATASSMVQPALSNMESTLGALKIDKWKKGTIREEAGDNVNAILKDLKTNVPPLLAEADAAPGALSKSIPLMKHLDALYDVLLRVEEGARVSGPGDQVDQLEAVLKQFGSARIQMYDSMAQAAGVHEKQVVDLQAEIKAERAKAEERKPAPKPESVPCTPPKPAPRRKRAAPKAAQPANGQPAQSPPANAQPAQKPPAQSKPQ